MSPSGAVTFASDAAKRRSRKCSALGIRLRARSTHRQTCSRSATPATRPVAVNRPATEQIVCRGISRVFSAPRRLVSLNPVGRPSSPPSPAGADCYRRAPLSALAGGGAFGSGAGSGAASNFRSAARADRGAGRGEIGRLRWRAGSPLLSRRTRRGRSPQPFAVARTSFGLKKHNFGP